MTGLGKLVDSFSWPIYCRSYLATMGGLLAGLGCLIVARQSSGMSSLAPGWQLGFGVALFIGAILVLTGLLGPSRTIERWAESWSRHEIAFVIMLLALPLYFVLAPIYSRR